MAHFSTILLTEQARGLEQRMAFCRSIEDRYGDTRQRDSERPLTEVDGSLPGDRRIIYDRGGWVFWMLHRLMGRETSFAAHREYLAMWRDTQDHPLIQDYLAVMRRHAPDTAAFDAYVKQWLFTNAVPQFLVSDATLVPAGDGWEMRARVKNTGGGTVAVEVAAVRGERFAKKPKAGEEWRDARASVTLAAGEEKPVAIRCDFQPRRLVVDPDVTVLMLERRKAEVDLKMRREPGVLASR